MGLAQVNKTLHDNANRGAVMTIVDPTDRTPLIGDDGQPATITLLGRDSDKYINAEREAQERNVESMSEGAKWSAAERDHRLLLCYAKCTVAWHNVPHGWLEITDDETPAVLTEESAYKLYKNAPWVKEQVDRFIANRANFSKA